MSRSLVIQIERSHVENNTPREVEKQRERRDLFETYRSQHLPLLSHGPSTFVYAWQNVGSRALGDRPRIYITEMIFAAKLFHRVQSGAPRGLRISGTANTRRKHT